MGGKFLQNLLIFCIFFTFGHALTGQSAKDLGDPKNLVEHFNVYPNPVINQAWVDIKLEWNANVKIEVLNILGERVIEIVNAHLSKGENRLSIEGDRLQKGTYFLRVEINRKIYKTIRLAKA